MQKKSSNQNRLLVELPKQTIVEATSKKKLRMLMKAHEGENLQFIEQQKEEYVYHDQQDYNDLDKWKKDLILRESDDVSDKIKKRFQHIQSLKEDITMPELNFEIVDSAMNPKYYEEDDQDNIHSTQHIENQDCIDEEEDENQSQKQQAILVNPEFKTNILSSFSKQNEKQNFTECNDEIRFKSLSNNQKSSKDTQPPTKENEKEKGKITQNSAPHSVDNKFPSTRINTQSSIFIQRKFNKQLLNNLLLTRITKKYQNSQSIESKGVGDKKNKKVSFDKKIEGQSFYHQDSKHKNQSLDQVKQIFSEETEKFSKTTLNTFKNVGNQFFRLTSIIEYDSLMKDIINTIYHPRGILNAKEIDGIKGGIEFDLESFNYLEKTLLDNYYRCTSEIAEHHNKIREERLFQTSITHEHKICHEEMTNQLAKIESEEEMLRNELRNASNMQLVQHSQSTKMNVIRFKNFQNPDIKVKHKKIEEEREEIRVYFDTIKKAISQRMKSSVEKLEIMDKEILKIKQKRNTTKMILKDLYFKSLKSDSFLSSQSLVWIIKSLININEDLSNTAIFPSFLDEQSKQFLIQWAKLSIEQDKITEQIKRVNIENKNISEQYQNLMLESTKVSTVNSREAIKQKMNRMARGSAQCQSSGCSPMSTKSFITSKSHANSKSNIFPGYDEVNNKSELNGERIAFDLNRFPEDCIQTVEMKNDMRHELMKITSIIGKLKDNERIRICKKIRTNTPGYQQKIIVLSQRLQALFGKLEGQTHFNRHLKEMSLFDEKINNVKFFKFSHINIQNTNVSKKVGEVSNTVEDPLCTFNATNQYKNQPSSPNNISQKQEESHSTTKDKFNQKLSLSKDIIENFKEKKDSIAQNHKIMLQYTQLSDELFHHNKERNKTMQFQNSEQLFQKKERNLTLHVSSNDHVFSTQERNKTQNIWNSEQQPHVLDNYFFNARQKQISTSSTPQSTPIIKSPKHIFLSNNYLQKHF